MLRKALTTAILLAATLAGTDARATPVMRLSVAIEDERITLATDRRSWGHSNAGTQNWGSRGDWGHHGQWRHKGANWRGNGYRRPNGYVARQTSRGVVVIVRPPYKSFRYGRAPLRPLIKNGSFARRPYW